MFAVALMFTLGVAAQAAQAERVEIVRSGAPFALEIGFVEVAPKAPLVAVVRDVAADEELVVDLVRIGKLGKGRARANVVVTSGASGAAGPKPIKRTLAVLAPTLKERALPDLAEGAFASLPVRQSAPLILGTSHVEIRVDAHMALRLSVQKRGARAADALALVPLPTPGPAVVPPAIEVPPLVAPLVAPVVAPTVAPVDEVKPVVEATAPVVEETQPILDETKPVAASRPPREVEVAVANPDGSAGQTAWPRLLAEVRAGSSVVIGGLQLFVPGGGARAMIGPRNLDAALGFALDFDGQSTFVDVPGISGERSGSWQMSSTKVRMEGHLGIGDLALFEARLGLTVGAGARFAWHTASLPGVQRTVFVVGATGRLAPEVAFPAGPGSFLISIPLDGTLDLSPAVTGFAPVAAGVFLGYRLDL